MIQLFLDNLDLVRKIVNKMNYGYADDDDLIQAGLMGLYLASQRFNESFGVTFPVFAKHYIVGEIKSELRGKNCIRLSKEIIRIIKEIKNYEKCSIEEIAFRLDTKKDSVLLALSYKDKILSLDEEELSDQLRNRILINVKNNVVTLDDVKNALKGEMYEIVYNRYFLGSTQAEMAEYLELSQSKISRMEKKALSILKKYCLNKCR